MKGIVINVDTYETTVIEVECPLCGNVSTFEYPNDDGYFKTERTASCEECGEELEFSYGNKKRNNIKQK